MSMAAAAAAAASSFTAVVNPFVPRVRPCVVSGLTGPHLVCRPIKNLGNRLTKTKFKTCPKKIRKTFRIGRPINVSGSVVASVSR
jgi:hypothetical protein